MHTRNPDFAGGRRGAAKTAGNGPAHPADMIFFWAKSNPEQPAIIQHNAAVTYKQLSEAIEAISGRIEELNLDKKEPVAVSIPHPAMQLAVCFALLRCGITTAPIDRGRLLLLRQNAINNVIHAGEGQVLSGGRNIRFEQSWLRRDGKSSTGWNAARPSRAADTDLIFFTSGTTGVPKKLIMPSCTVADRIALLLWPIASEASFERVLVIPDLASSYGFMLAAMLMYAGKTACFAPDYESQLQLINTFRVEVVIGSAQQMLGLVQTVERNGNCQLGSLKEARIGAGFSSDALVRRVQSRLCRNVATEYGATETSLVATADYDVIADVPNAVGFVMPNTTVEIVDGTGTSLPPGQEGIVRARSRLFASVFAANNPEKAQDANTAWWYSGDYGRLYESGILCIGGRADDMVNCGGVKIFAGVLEEFLRGCTGIRDAGICAVRGPSGIEEAWAGIVTDADVDISDLKKSLAESQESQVTVGQILVVEQIPRTSLGKIQRYQLKEMLINLSNPSMSKA